MTAAAIDERPWSHHERVLWPEPSALVEHIDDNFPEFSGLIRAAEARVVTINEFERENGNLWGTILVIPPRDRFFALSIFRDRIVLDQEAVLRSEFSTRRVRPSGV